MNSFQYTQPDFTGLQLDRVPDAPFVPAPADAVLPEEFFATSNLPTYVKVDGRWLRPSAPRMDGAVVREATGELAVREPRLVKRGDPVVVGEAEDGSAGIFVHAEGFVIGSHSPNEFQFMGTAVSRERPADYERLARLLGEEKRREGHIAWVAGPALVHSRARRDFVWFIEHGYVGVLLGGNAIAVHDLEAAMYGTTLGMTATGQRPVGGHALHMRAINAIRRAGSIEAAVDKGLVTDGIMYSLVKKAIPYVLAGSIRDDGPLPGVIPDVLDAQDAMRAHTVRATFAVFVATALHGIAVGNMLPAYVDRGGDDLRPLTTICVDQTEFVVNKLKDRGTHQAFGVVTNAQDFMHVLRFYVERWEQANPF